MDESEKEVKDPEGVKRMTEEEISDLAIRIVKGEVFITNTKEGIRNSFQILLIFGGDKLQPFADQIGAIWEDMSEAGPSSINGYPFFTSGHFLHIDDMSILDAAVERKRKALQNA